MRGARMRSVWVAGATAAAVILGLVASIAVQEAELSVVAGGVAFGALALWLFLNQRLGWSCVVIGLYLLLLDGFLKLATGSNTLTLGRDVLIFAVAIGYLARASIRRTPLRLPPLGVWILAYVAIVLVQLANPGNYSGSHSLAALKPDLEFVPLFFLGYAALQSAKALKVFVVLLLVCAAANGVVGLVQLNLTADQLASWGPGYSERVNGTATVSGRVYVDDSGQVRTRPFGLGTDAGSGGLVGVLAVGAALAAVLLASQRRMSLWIAVLVLAPPLAIITGQGRTTLVAGVAAALVFTALAVSARRLVPSLVAVMLALVVVFGVTKFVGDSSSTGVFDRYKTLKPSALIDSTRTSRGSSIERIPQLLTEYPLGAGVGWVGPARARLPAGTVEPANIDGETTFTYLTTEVGIPGLVILFGLNILVIGRAFAVIRRFDIEIRYLLAALVAGVVGIFTTWVSGAPLAGAPGAPYFWFTLGALAFWLYPALVLRPTPGAPAEAESEGTVSSSRWPRRPRRTAQ